MNKKWIAAFLGLGFSLGAFAQSTPSAALARGEYIVRITGCNDCHTPGYPEKGGKVPTSQWLTGSPVGFKGPWGVSYPINLRLFMQSLTEDQWVTFAKNNQARPPMPWFTLQMISDSDLRDTYQFVKSLGPAGTLAPNALPPGEAIKTKYIDFVPTSTKHWNGFSRVTSK
jgi:mono/diheme cytochrome c family protein